MVLDQDSELREAAPAPALDQQQPVPKRRGRPSKAASAAAAAVAAAPVETVAEVQDEEAAAHGFKPSHESLAVIREDDQQLPVAAPEPEAAVIAAAAAVPELPVAAEVPRGAAHRKRQPHAPKPESQMTMAEWFGMVKRQAMEDEDAERQMQGQEQPAAAEAVAVPAPAVQTLAARRKSRAAPMSALQRMVAEAAAIPIPPRRKAPTEDAENEAVAAAPGSPVHDKVLSPQQGSKSPLGPAQVNGGDKRGSLAGSKRKSGEIAADTSAVAAVGAAEQQQAPAAGAKRRRKLLVAKTPNAILKELDGPAAAAVARRLRALGR